MTNKPIFVHIPRTGGGSVSRLSWIHSAGHITYSSARKFFPTQFMFTIIRNPVDRFISCMEPIYLDTKGYTDILDEWANASLKEFIEIVAGRLNKLNFCTDPKFGQFTMFWSQYEQVKGIDRFIAHEKLIDGLRLIADETGNTFKPHDLIHINKSKLNKPELSQEACSAIESHYKNDMDMWREII